MVDHYSTGTVIAKIKLFPCDEYGPYLAKLERLLNGTFHNQNRNSVRPTSRSVHKLNGGLANNFLLNLGGLQLNNISLVRVSPIFG